MIKEILPQLLDGIHLSRDEAVTVMNEIMEGNATPSQIAGMLIALKLKGEQAEEVAGFVDSMRAHLLPVPVEDEMAIDGVGTGGDGSHSFNISTAAGIVAAAAGVTVAKHGNRSISSSCGSADLLEATGADIDPGVERVAECINSVGFGFMFAPRFHPAMKYAAAPRKEMGVRTVFNILGPMTNPAGVKRQVTGVYDWHLMPLITEVLRLTGSEHVLTVHSHDSMDELSVSAPTDCLDWRNGELTEMTLSPEDVGLATWPAGSVRGGDAAENHRILQRVLDGERGACRDAVLFNAGAMIYVAGQAGWIGGGVMKAAEAIDSGAAKNKLQAWVDLTRK